MNNLTLMGYQRALHDIIIPIEVEITFICNQQFDKVDVVFTEHS